jgi:hypothetical protein
VSSVSPRVAPRAGTSRTPRAEAAEEGQRLPSRRAGWLAGDACPGAATKSKRGARAPDAQLLCNPKLRLHSQPGGCRAESTPVLAHSKSSPAGRTRARLKPTQTCSRWRGRGLALSLGQTHHAGTAHLHGLPFEEGSWGCRTSSCPALRLVVTVCCPEHAERFCATAEPKILTSSMFAT